MKSIFTSLLLFFIITDALGQKNEGYKQEEIIYARLFNIFGTTQKNTKFLPIKLALPALLLVAIWLY